MEKNLIGWQKQPNKLNIQGTIEKAIEQITGENVELIASGRTDSGVHALRASSKLQNKFKHSNRKICNSN